MVALLVIRIYAREKKFVQGRFALDDKVKLCIPSSVLIVSIGSSEIFICSEIKFLNGKLNTVLEQK